MYDLLNLPGHKLLKMTQLTTRSSTNTTPSSQLPSMNVVDYTDTDSFDRFLTGIANAFTSTPLSLAFICEMDDTPPPYPSPTIDATRLLKHITAGITENASNNAILLESGDYSALAVWETTTFTGRPFTAHTNKAGPIRGEWRERVNELKRRHIGTRIDQAGEEQLKPHYHLGYLARNPCVPSVPGAVSAVLRPMLEQAIKEGVVVWLEATYEHAVEVYRHFGFRTVELVHVGVGQTSEEGWPEAGGSGTRGWTMVFDQHLQTHQNGI